MPRSAERNWREPLDDEQDWSRSAPSSLREEQVWRDSLRDFDFVPDSAPKLTPDQQQGMGCHTTGFAARRAGSLSCCTA